MEMEKQTSLLPTRKPWEHDTNGTKSMEMEKQTSLLPTRKPWEHDTNGTRSGVEPCFVSFPPPQIESKQPDLSLRLRGGDKRQGRFVLRMTVWNFFNFIFGIGIFSLPFAIKLCGWYGIVVQIAVGLIMQFTVRVLGICQQQNVSVTYSEVIQSSLGVCGELPAILILYLLTIFEVSALVMVFSTGISLLFLSLSRVGCFVVSTVLLIIVSNTLFRIPSFADWLVPAGTACFGGITVTLIVVFFLKGSEEASKADWTETVIHDRPFVTDVYKIFEAIGIFMYCFLGHVVYPTLARNMVVPKQISKLLVPTYIMLQASYVLISAAGYMAYGVNTAPNVLTNIATSHPAARYVLAVLVICAVSIKYALLTAPLMESFIDWIKLYLNEQERSTLVQQEKDFEALHTVMSQPGEIQEIQQNRGDRAKHKPGQTYFQDLLQKGPKALSSSARCGGTETEALFGKPVKQYLRDKARQMEYERDNPREPPHWHPPLVTHRSADKFQLLRAMPIPYARTDISTNRPSSPAERRSIEAVQHLSRTTPHPEEDHQRAQAAAEQGRCNSHLFPQYRWIALQFLLRSILPVLALVTTLPFADVAQLLTFIGGIFGSILAIMFPPLCFVFTFRKDQTALERCSKLFIAAVGAIVFAMTAVVMHRHWA